ncbi:MAG: hypothetical protein JWM02_3123 [Frankiales bacterium]|nr:hypothetical protein [Frankiales bacterium]
MLPQRDIANLEAREIHYEFVNDGGQPCLVLRGYQLPPGFEPSTVDVLIRIPPGFPDAAPDMWWFDPPAKIAATGAYPQAADQMEVFAGRTWQRFSRHLGPGSWIPGRDDLWTYLALMRHDLERTVGAA